jgi:hypothetical protein
VVGVVVREAYMKLVKAGNPRTPRVLRAVVTLGAVVMLGAAVALGALKRAG